MSHEPQYKYGRIQTLLGTTAHDKIVGDFNSGVVNTHGDWDKQIFVSVEVEADEDFTSSTENLLLHELQSVSVASTTRHFMGRHELVFAVPKPTAVECGFIDSHYGVIEVTRNDEVTNGTGKLTCYFLRPYTVMADLYKPHKAIMLFARVEHLPELFTPLPEDSVYMVTPEPQ